MGLLRSAYKAFLPGNIGNLVRPDTIRHVGADSMQYTGVVPLANAIDRSGPYGKVINAVLGLDKVKDSQDILSGREKWDAPKLARHGSPYASYEDARYEKKKAAADEQFKRNEEEQKRIASDIAYLRASYGIYDGTPTDDRGRALAGFAHDNQGDRTDAFASLGNDELAFGVQDLNRQYDDQLLNERRAAAATGQTGGTVDSQAKADSLRDYLRAYQHIAGGARANVDQAVANDHGDRLNLEGAIRTGSSPYDDTMGSIADWRYGLRTSRDNLFPEGVGQAFAYGGTLAQQDGMAQGQGYRGLSLFDNTSSSRGSVSSASSPWAY